MRQRSSAPILGIFVTQHKRIIRPPRPIIFTFDEPAVITNSALGAQSKAEFSTRWRAAPLSRVKCMAVAGHAGAVILA